MNKKGSEMTIGTIVIIVLALVVLVVLIVGFTQGWSSMWEKIKCIGGCGSNVDTVVQSCELACTSGSTYSYCKDDRTLRFKDGDKTIKVQVTCQKLADRGSIEYEPGKTTTIPSTGLSCSNINCGSAPEEKKTCSDLGGIWGTGDACPTGKENLTPTVTDETGKGTNTLCCQK